MTIVVTGGSGFIGKTLSQELLSKGHTVIVVARSAPQFTHERLYFINCDLAVSPLPYNILEHTDAVIHLVGRTIFRRWNKKVKKEIRDSRILSTKRVVESIAHATNRPPVFICASAIAIYGNSGNEPIDEQGPIGKGFMPELTEEWEKEAEKASDYGVRVVCMRSARVLGHSKLLAMYKKTARLGFLMRLKKDDFWMSWIHEDDIIRAYLFALETSTLQGVVNATAPNPTKESVFMKSLSRAMRRPVFGVMPQWLANILFGELHEELTRNRRAIPQKLINKGFNFLYPEIKGALEEIFPGKSKHVEQKREQYEAY